MVLGDFCVPKPPKANRYRDTQSNHYLAHHNLAALCWGISLANRVFDSETVNRQHTIARVVGEAVEAIDKIIASGTMSTLTKCRPSFVALRHSAKSADDERAAV
jgi:hypothetical protein